MVGVQGYDAIVVLGGGRTNDGKLTLLSTQRLDRGSELYKSGVAQKVLVLGDHYSTYLPHSIFFDKTGAEIRKDYLCEHGVASDDVILVPDGRDTMLEAFASRKAVRDMDFKRLLLVTSDKHMERGLYIFRRIMNKDIAIEGSSVPCGDLLNEAEEREYLALVRRFLDSFPEEIPDPNMETWIKDQAEYYRQHREIHDKYHPAGKESQAYMGVAKKESLPV